MIVPVLKPESPEIDEPMQIITDSDELEEIMKHLTKVLPPITKPKEHNRLEKWVAFLTWFPLAGSFDVDHIAS